MKKSELILGCLFNFFFLLDQNNVKKCTAETTKYQLPLSMFNEANGYSMQEFYLHAS